MGTRAEGRRRGGGGESRGGGGVVVRWRWTRRWGGSGVEAKRDRQGRVQGGR